MNNKVILSIFSFVCIALVFTSLLPYPVFSHQTNLTDSNVYEINNNAESEVKNIHTEKVFLSDVDFSVVNQFIPVGYEFEIIELGSEQKFCVKRIGGQNHFDITPVSEEDFATIQKLFDQSSWQRHPVLVQLNDTAFVPASFCAYNHGYGSEEFAGHFCLHFKNSKTDGSKAIDRTHQKTIKHAKKLAKSYLSQL